MSGSDSPYTPPGYGYKAIDAVDFMEMELPPRELLISPWLPSQSLCLIYAPCGVGKTFFAMEITLAFATGRNFLSWETHKTGKVLYIDGEMAGSDLQERLQKQSADTRKLMRDQIMLITPDLQGGPCPDLTQKSSQLAIQPHVDRADLIIVDNISTLCRTGSENEAESWAPVQEWAIKQRSAGKSILFVHHAGKAGKQRGTSKREDVMDTVINLKKPEGYQESDGARFEIHFDKHRGFHGPDAEPFEAKLVETHDGYKWEWSEPRESTVQKVASLHKDGLLQRDIAEILEVDQSTVSKNLKVARESGYLD